MLDPSLYQTLWFGWMRRQNEDGEILIVGTRDALKSSFCVADGLYETECWTKMMVETAILEPMECSSGQMAWSPDRSESQ